MVGPAGVPEANRIKGLRRQTVESCPIDFQRFFARVANRGTADPPQNETAVSTGIESGGDEIGKLASVSEVEFYSSHRILATHFGLGDGR